MGKFIAVVGCSFSFVNPAHSGTVTVTSSPSTKVKADGNFVYTTPLSITITNGSDGSITNATGSGVINATATKVKVEGIFVMRVDDISVPITMTGTNPSPPPPTATYVTTVEINDAGNTKTKAE